MGGSGAAWPGPARRGDEMAQRGAKESLLRANLRTGDGAEETLVVDRGLKRRSAGRAAQPEAAQGGIRGAGGLDKILPWTAL